MRMRSCNIMSWAYIGDFTELTNARKTFKSFPPLLMILSIFYPSFILQSLLINSVPSLVYFTVFRSSSSSTIRCLFVIFLLFAPMVIISFIFWPIVRFRFSSFVFLFGCFERFHLVVRFCLGSSTGCTSEEADERDAL